MKKKMRKFNDGGLSKAQEEWLGGADRTDPIIMARMRSAVPDEVKKDEVKKAVLEETSSDLDPYGAADKKPTSVEKTVVKTKVTPAPKSTTEDVKAPLPTKAKSDALKQLREDIGTGSMPKSFTAAGGNTKASKSTATLPSVKFSMPDPLAGFDSKGKRYSGRDTDDRRKGGVIKKMSNGGSASSRGDGIAKRGKTRGKIC